MTTPDDAGMYTRSHAEELHGRWLGYLSEAREALGADAPLERLVEHAANEWARREPPALGFVPEAMRAMLRASEHDTSDDAFLDRIVNGEVTALRRHADGGIVFLAPERLAAMTSHERAEYEPYDPLLARALRRRALDADMERVALEEEEHGER